MVSNRGCVGARRLAPGMGAGPVWTGGPPFPHSPGNHRPARGQVTPHFHSHTGGLSPCCPAHPVPHPTRVSFCARFVQLISRKLHHCKVAIDESVCNIMCQQFSDNGRNGSGKRQMKEDKQEQSGTTLSRSQKRWQPITQRIHDIRPPKTPPTLGESRAWEIEKACGSLGGYGVRGGEGDHGGQVEPVAGAAVQAHVHFQVVPPVDNQPLKPWLKERRERGGQPGEGLVADGAGVEVCGLVGG